MKPIKFRTAASRDLRGIGQETRKRWGDEQAALYVASLRDAINSLRTFPLRHPIFEGYGIDLRYMTSGRHTVFYLIAEDRIEIVRVLHTAMDFARWLD